MSNATMVYFGCLEDGDNHHLGEAASKLYNALQKSFNPQEAAQVLVLLHVMLFKWNSTVADNVDFYLGEYEKAFKDALASMTEVDVPKNEGTIQ